MIYRIIDSKTNLFKRDDFKSNGGEVALNVQPAVGMHRPKWDGNKWIEDMPQAEIDAIIAQAEYEEPTATELMQAEIVALKSRLAKIEAVPIVKTALKPVIKDTILAK